MRSHTHPIYLWHFKYNKVVKTLQDRRGFRPGGKRIGKQYILSIYEEDREDFTAAPVHIKKEMSNKYSLRIYEKPGKLHSHPGQSYIKILKIWTL